MQTYIIDGDNRTLCTGTWVVEVLCEAVICADDAAHDTCNVICD